MTITEIHTQIFEDMLSKFLYFALENALELLMNLTQILSVLHFPNRTSQQIQTCGHVYDMLLRAI
jgi:hypothetical protein